MSEARLDAIILACLRDDVPANDAPTDDEVFAGIDEDLPLDAVPVTETDHLNWLLEKELRMETYSL